MKKWYVSPPGGIKLLLHLISLLFLFFSFLFVLNEVAGGENPQAWTSHLSGALACSIILEIFFKYGFFIPGYCKRINTNGAKA